MAHPGVDVSRLIQPRQVWQPVAWKCVFKERGHFLMLTFPLLRTGEIKIKMLPM